MSAFNDPRLLKAEREAREGPACQHCGYSLVGLLPSAPCPECGTPRQHPEEMRRAKLSRSQGLMRATTIEQYRFAAGFAGLTLSLANIPILLILDALLTQSTALWVLWLAALWWISLAMLLLRRFSVGAGDETYATSAPAVLIGASLATQWLWFAAAAAPLVITLPAWTTPALLAVAALGLFPTMWCVGDLLEWGGDETTGQNTKWLLLMPVYVGAGGAALGYLLTLVAFRIPGVITIMVKGAIFVTGLYVYGALIYRLYGGFSMALWARRLREKQEGRTERIDAHRAKVEAEQAKRVAHNERVAKSMHAKKDTPVTLDDFDT